VPVRSIRRATLKRPLRRHFSHETTSHSSLPTSLGGSDRTVTRHAVIYLPLDAFKQAGRNRGQPIALISGLSLAVFRGALGGDDFPIKETAWAIHGSDPILSG
jgi:hypothetical protein